MGNTIKRIRHEESLARLGSFLRRRREALGLVQGRVGGMRQPTVSKIERGGDVNLATLIGYAGALGLELTFVPVGQSLVQPAAATPARPLDLLDEFADLADLRDDAP